MTPPKHPKALYLLFVTEMWERFSYYGMRALLTIYAVSTVANGGLGWSAKEAGQLYGIYTGLAYVTPLLGGFLADKFLGNQRSILMGGLLMAIGHAILAVPSIAFFFAGLVLLIIGNGFFKPNISSMVGQLYPENSPLKDSAYTIFYMGINVGAMFGTLLCGYLGEKIGWHYGFGAAGVFMFLGVIIFYFFKSMLGEIGKKPSRNLENKEKTTNEPLSSVERSRVGVIFILSFFSIMFWMAFEQAGSSFSLFALNYTDRNLPMFDFIVPASWFQSLNSLFVIVFAPIVSIIWIKVAEMNIYLSSPRKFAIGLALLSVGCWIMVFGSLSIAQNQNTAQVSMLFLFFAILLHTLGELCLSPVGLSSVNKLAPKKMISIMFGVWFFASAMGNYLSGYIGGLIEELSKQWSMSGFFMMTALATSFSAALLFILSPFIQKMMHERA